MLGKIKTLQLLELIKECEEKEIVLFTMVEILILIEKYGREIMLNENGEFVIPKIILDSFVENLEYDIELVKLLEKIKEEFVQSQKLINIDANEIFFIMKNSKNFGLENIVDHKQFFQFVNIKKDKIIQGDITSAIFEDEYSDKSNCIKVIVEDEIDQDTFLSNKKNEELLFEEKVQLTKENFNTIKTEITEEGYTKITYPNETVVTLDGPWKF